MAEPHVITALVAKYRELSGKLRACETEADKLRLDLSHIDAAIRVFRHDYDTASILPRRPYRRNPHFTKGIFIRTAMSILQEVSSPVTTRELAQQTLERQGVAEPEKQLIETLRRALNGCLMRRTKEGSVIVHNCYPRRWATRSSTGEANETPAAAIHDRTPEGSPESLKATLRTLASAMPTNDAFERDKGRKKAAAVVGAAVLEAPKGATVIEELEVN
jgi:hypothetical protein